MAFFPSSSKPETRSLWPFFHHHFLWPSSAALLYFYGSWLLPGTHSDKSRIISLFCQLMSNLKSMCRLNSPLPWNNILLGIRMWIAFWGRGFSANHSLITRPCLFLKSSSFFVCLFVFYYHFSGNGYDIEISTIVRVRLLASRPRHFLLI